jgi:hypothetical protein
MLRLCGHKYPYAHVSMTFLTRLILDGQEVSSVSSCIELLAQIRTPGPLGPPRKSSLNDGSNSDARTSRPTHTRNHANDDRSNCDACHHVSEAQRICCRARMLNVVLAQPFLINGTFCPGSPVFSNSPFASFISSPHATPTSAS